jgi:hypothetical protein
MSGLRRVPQPAVVERRIRYLAGFMSARQIDYLSQHLVSAECWEDDVLASFDELRRRSSAAAAVDLGAAPEAVDSLSRRDLAGVEARLIEFGLVRRGEPIMFRSVRIAALVPTHWSVDFTEICEREVPPAGDTAALFELCTAAEDVPPPQQAPDGSFVFASRAPLSLVTLRPKMRRVRDGDYEVAVQVVRWPNIVRVCEYADRHFLIDGHHRALALLRAGHDRLLCHYTRAAAAADVKFRGNSFDLSQLCVDRPPVLADFLDAALVYEVTEGAAQQLLHVELNARAMRAPVVAASAAPLPRTCAPPGPSPGEGFDDGES